jgi:hypothetical protein
MCRIAALETILGQKPTSSIARTMDGTAPSLKKFATLSIGDSTKHQQITTLHIS